MTNHAPPSPGTKGPATQNPKPDAQNDPHEPSNVRPSDKPTPERSPRAHGDAPLGEDEKAEHVEE